MQWSTSSMSPYRYAVALLCLLSMLSAGLVQSSLAPQYTLEVGDTSPEGFLASGCKAQESRAP